MKKFIIRAPLPSSCVALVGGLLLASPALPGVTALIDYDRLRPQVEAVADGHFNLPLLRRLLRSLRVSNTLLVSSSAGDERVVDVAARLGFHSVLADARPASWMGHALLHEQAQVSRVGARDLVVVGASADDVKAIRAQRPEAATLTVVHWPEAFDLDLIGLTEHHIVLGPEFILDPESITRHLMGQAA